MEPDTIYPEIQAKIDAWILNLLDSSRKYNGGEPSYAYVVGCLSSTIKWAIAHNDINHLKREIEP